MESNIVLINIVRAKNVSDLNISILKEPYQVWTSHLYLCNDIAPLDLLEVEIINPIQVHIETGVITSHDKGL